MGKKQDKIKAIAGDAGEMMGRDSGLQIRDVGRFDSKWFSC